MPIRDPRLKAIKEKQQADRNTPTQGDKPNALAGRFPADFFRQLDERIAESKANPGPAPRSCKERWENPGTNGQ